MDVLRYSDNSRAKDTFAHDGNIAPEREAAVRQALLRFAGREMSDLLKDNPGLLIIPPDFSSIKDGLARSTLFDIGRDDKIQTGNIVGSFGLTDAGVCFSIHSRFDRDDRQYFLHYLLQRVWGAHMLDMPTFDDRDPIHDFAVYLFPSALKMALSKGVFRTYCAFQRDDAHVRGAVSVSRFIRNDMPFAGRVAYDVRERSADNSLTQLIRHVIEYIESSEKRGILNSDDGIRAAVSSIRGSTPTYDKGQRSAVIARNLRPVRHPYYQEYSYLQRLCLQILRGERMSISSTGEHEICGIVFDVAWLWEEYLAKVMREGIHMGELCHPQNRVRSNPIYLFEGNRGVAYPDFMWRRKEESEQNYDVIMDAKYKRLSYANGKLRSVSREDRMQMVSYLYATKAEGGVFLFPKSSQPEGECGDGVASDADELIVEEEGKSLLVGRMKGLKLENGRSAEIRVLPFEIPEYSKADSFSVFSRRMKAEEESFCKLIVSEMAHD